LERSTGFSTGGEFGQGLATFWHKNAQKMAEGNYKDGKAHVSCSMETKWREDIATEVKRLLATKTTPLIKPQSRVHWEAQPPNLWKTPKARSHSASPVV